MDSMGVKEIDTKIKSIIPKPFKHNILPCRALYGLDHNQLTSSWARVKLCRGEMLLEAVDRDT